MKKIALLLMAILLSATIGFAQKYAVGEKVDVLWKGKWYAATILTVETGNKYKIHYDGYASSWDEVVGTDRIKPKKNKPHKGPAGGESYAVGDKVDVLWKDKWYAATILTKENGNKYKIHYDGYASSWDEVVGTDRIRPKKKPHKGPAGN